MATDLAKIVHAAAPGTGIQLRPEPYGKKGVCRFLRDVLAMANASVEGFRYIIVGAEIDKQGNKRLSTVSRKDFSGKPSYQRLVTDYIEPPIRLQYHAVSISGKRVGVFEIHDCLDRPYMMRIDHSETLRRGDAYIRVDDAAIKMGRRQLQEMFERKFRDSVSAEQIEIGFPGEIIHKNLKVPTVDLAQLPSAAARIKLNQLLSIQAGSKDSGSTTGVIRLVHARVFGSDNPYETWTPEKLMQEMADLETKHHMDDLHFLFEENGTELQLVVYNQGDESIKDASLSLVMPSHDAFYVASQLPKLRQDESYLDRPASETAAYPTVNLKDGAVHVSHALDQIPTDSLVHAFGTPLRICVGSDLKGRKLGIHYSLSGRNLRTLAKGKLRLLLS